MTRRGRYGIGIEGAERERGAWERWDWDRGGIGIEGGLGEREK